MSTDPQRRLCYAYKTQVTASLCHFDQTCHQRMKMNPAGQTGEKRTI